MHTAETVHEFLHRIAEGDPERIGQLFAERVDWKLDWPDGDHTRAVPWIRHRSTRAEAADHFRELAAHHVPGESDAHVHAVLVDGADAVVLGEVAHTAKPTGRRYAAAFALHLTVADGLITRYHVYEDSLAVARAFGPA
ncbi:MAG TPA: nuclear transport factor 2 family protein [Pseudonocardia sp.]|uniref:nuclear transport factor 2 family protein n=1 Tax=Pseudonocardia sp. TaxID=60912 RepID=UPI002B4AD09F|nr:nuclear transport factor 2 family protein [Pseudonocardia sp.]HLU54912.1 nuclear transport factor 2 family protein [Pseudonocardia sp.]